MKLCLKLSKLLLLPLLLFSCGNPYKELTASTQHTSSAMRFRPMFQKELYRCIVDGKFLFKKFHLSGLLLLKIMENGTTYVAFQSEMGLSFFDFEWDQENRFKINRVIPQLDKPAVIKVLQKDIQLLLLKNLNAETEQHFMKGSLDYDRFSLEKGYAYYISRQDKLTAIENAGKKKVTTIEIGEKASLEDLPKSVLFKHHKANFTIRLTKIEDHADE